MENKKIIEFKTIGGVIQGEFIEQNGELITIKVTEARNKKRVGKQEKFNVMDITKGIEHIKPRFGLSQEQGKKITEIMAKPLRKSPLTLSRHIGQQFSPKVQNHDFGKSTKGPTYTDWVKWLIGVIIIAQIFPIIIIMLGHLFNALNGSESSTLGLYFFGWFINIIIMIVIGLVFFVDWLFNSKKQSWE